jgi:dihydroneopterin triphosphate diphosphatase
VNYKQPRSIQVVIFASAAREYHYLLLKRVASQGGFWQSVTGSLEGEETHRVAAVREVVEETGIIAREEELIELGVVNTFAIAPQWRAKYAPEVTHNEEVCFALKALECEVQVDSIEHDAYVWVTYEHALKMVHWDSNKRALAAARLLGE